MLTIVTPNLNNANYLKDNILSIMNLSIPFEHIIVDGGSTDGSLDIINEFKHVKLIEQKEKTGMYGAIHQGFLESSGDYLTYVNADDRIVKDGFEKMYKKIVSNKLDFIYSDGFYNYIDKNKMVFSKGRMFGKFFLKHGFMPMIQPASIFSKDIYFKVGGLRFDKFRICGDFDLFYRMAKQEGSSFKYIKEVSVIFMKRGDSLGDLNHSLYEKEINDNCLPKPNFLNRILFFVFKII